MVGEERASYDVELVVLSAVSPTFLTASETPAFVGPAGPAAPAAPAGPAGPTGPGGPAGPRGICPALKSTRLSVPLVAFDEVTRLGFGWGGATPVPGG